MNKSSEALEVAQKYFDALSSKKRRDSYFPV